MYVVILKFSYSPLYFIVSHPEVILKSSWSHSEEVEAKRWRLCPLDKFSLNEQTDSLRKISISWPPVRAKNCIFLFYWRDPITISWYCCDPPKRFVLERSHYHFMVVLWSSSSVHFGEIPISSMWYCCDPPKRLILGRSHYHFHGLAVILQ